MSKALTPPEITAFERLEKVIEAGQKTFVEVGLALTEIREKKLYRKDYETFDAYCQGRWGWGQKRASQLIIAANTVKLLPKPLSTMVESERVAREIGKLPVPQQKHVLQEAKKSGEPLTAVGVKKHLPPPPVVKKSLPVPAAKPTAKPPDSKPLQPVIVTDKTGWPIPTALLPLWERAHEVQEILTVVSRVKGTLRSAQESKDLLFSSINFSSALSHFDQAWSDTKEGLPYAVCTACQGKMPKACGLCHGRGFISEFKYNSVVSKETKEMRAKAKK